MSQHKYLDLTGLETYHNRLRSGVLTFTDTENQPVTYKPGDSIDLSSGVYYATTSKTATRVSNPLTIKTLDGDIEWNGSNKATIDLSTMVIVKGDGANSAVLKGLGATATALGAISLGYNTEASGHASHAEGGGTKALSEVAHTEGLNTVAGRISQIIDPATGNIRELTNEEISILAGEAFRIGLITTQSEFNTAVAMKLIGFASHAEGSETKALGTSSHAEGNNTEAASNSSHAEGDSTHAWGEASHAEGYLTEANGNQSHSEGKQTKAQGNSSHAEGKQTKAQGNSSHAEGIETQALKEASHTEGTNTIANGNSSHAEGKQTKAQGNSSHAEGIETQALKEAAHAEGTETIANGNSSHAEGIETQANGWGSHAEGGYNITTGSYSHIEGRGNYIGDNDNYSTGAVDINTKAYCAHAEGQCTKATGNSSHAEGVLTKALGTGSHSEGRKTTASGNASHAEGSETTASGDYSHTSGQGTTATHKAEFACGKYNVSNSDTLFSIGNGTSSAKKNAFEVKTNNTAYVNGSKVATEAYVDSAIDVSKCVRITYGDLVDLRNNGLLIPGTWYRITDYVTTTSQDNTMSAEHTFDIVVLALDECKLADEAWATNSNDGYFDDCNLSAWKIWYCLDNDTNRFAWADATNGKGVIYRMIDEWGNDCPYDFKNIMFYGGDTNSGYVYTFNTIDSSDGTPYDASVKQAYITYEDDGYYIYTVWYHVDVKNNKIGPSFRSDMFDWNKMALPWVLFKNIYNNTSNNVVGNDCWWITFSSGSMNNVGDNCSYITISDGNNVIGSNCESVFTSQGYNTVGNSCGEITLRGGHNTVGNFCSFISLGSSGNNCSSNVFGNNCNYISSGNNCSNNVFRNNCNSINLGTYCSHNVFGNNCSSSDLGNYNRYNIIGNKSSVKFLRQSGYDTLRNYCQYNTIADNCTVSIYNSSTTTSNAGTHLKNYYINTSGEITLNTVGVDYEIRVEKNSNGEIKQYCLADLIK